ncbi:hypothetical protein NDU88_002453 [Pleurodeles waltl]|uniref:Uncharacterized protein n=1 Tax=Pleurodeles waltl TaxID=8319 RepID=A0AAV7RC08_PLEWA|nr:hypothetical protein NDU88_002453 [Pleurodeles waltl]
MAVQVCERGTEASVKPRSQVENGGETWEGWKSLEGAGRRESKIREPHQGLNPGGRGRPERQSTGWGGERSWTGREWRSRASGPPFALPLADLLGEGLTGTVREK